MSKARTITVRSAFPIALCVTIFYVGWGKFALAGDAIYLVDYALRLALCALAAWLGGLRATDFQVASWGRVVGLSALVLAAILLSYTAYRALNVPIPLFGLPIAKFPDIERTWLTWIDLSFGMGLVALSEELVFRFLFVRADPKSGAWLYALSSLAFGFLHAPQGLGLVIEATLAGALLMWLYRSTRTLTAPVAVHFLADLILISGIGCPYGIGDC